MQITLHSVYANHFALENPKRILDVTSAPSPKLPHFICFLQNSSCLTFLANLTTKLFRDLSNHYLRRSMNVNLSSYRTAMLHCTFYLKASRLEFFTSVISLRPNLFRSKVTALICGKSHQALHLCKGVTRGERGFPLPRAPNHHGDAE